MQGPNWKVAYDGYLDFYHLPILHRESFGPKMPSDALYDAWGPHQRESMPKRVLATLALTAGESDCWGSEPVFRDGALVGYVTSGGYGWRVGRSLAVGWIDAPACAPGTELEVEVLTRRLPATAVRDPLYDPNNSRMLG